MGRPLRNIGGRRRATHVNPAETFELALNRMNCFSLDQKVFIMEVFRRRGAVYARALAKAVIETQFAHHSPHARGDGPGEMAVNGH